EKGHETIALLVNLENTRAYALYEKLGYIKDEIVMLVGEPYAQLVKTLNVKISIS
uniref:GNAT family N-acetyltransferase n=1 Tax=Bacillus paralicheniformis TaxID=1648923 RepID=UPI0020BF1BE1